jgi:hemerythrin-like domain-containing protein
VPASIRTEPLPVIEMRLVHDVHRAATSLLAEAAARPDLPPGELGELRDFTVAALRHHHQSEDDALWPICETVDPEVEAALRELSAEHRRLDDALDALEALPVAARAERASLAAAAEEVRELVQQHMAHEEAVTFPSLRLLTAAQWAEFSRAAMESAPAAGVHLQIGLMDEVGDPGDVAAVFAGLPAPAVQALPAMRARARATLGALRAGRGAAS